MKNQHVSKLPSKSKSQLKQLITNSKISEFAQALVTYPT